MPDLDKLIEELSSLTVIEAVKLSKLLEERWGVSATAPAPALQTPATLAPAPEPEKTEFNLVLISSGERKINVIKEVRAITGLGLKEAKDATEGVPKMIKEGISKADAEKFKKQLEDAGAVVELQ